MTHRALSLLFATFILTAGAVYPAELPDSQPVLPTSVEMKQAELPENHWDGSFSKAEPPYMHILGLVDKRKWLDDGRPLFHKTVYTYKADNDRLFALVHPVKGAKDLRPYDTAHPIRAKIVEVGNRWNGAMSAASSAVSGTVSAFALWQLLQLK